MCTCAYVHMHVYLCGGHPPTTPHPHPSTPTPRGAGSPKHQNSISLELIEIIWFCLKILYLWTFLNSYSHIDYSWSPQTPPTPIAEKTQIGRITITLEWIKIIQFCLKICDPWTLLHTYRLGLMYRWGGCPIPNGTFMFWTQKSTSFLLLWASDKIFSCFWTWSH